MDFKNFINRFIWKPEHEYSFSLSDTDTDKNVNYIPDKNLNTPKSIFSSVTQNLDYIKVRFNTLINSDIQTREFLINAKGMHYKAFLLFIDGMIDSNLISDFVLKPLMVDKKASSDNISSISLKNGILVRKVKKFDLGKYIYNCLIPQNNVSEKINFDEISSSVNSGNCILFIDTLNIAFDIDVKGFSKRGVEAPTNEVVIRGPQEAFVENIRTNTSLLRRIVNNEKLVIENVEVGDLTKTKCAICYMENIANSDLVSEVRFRMNNLKVDSILSSR